MNRSRALTLIVAVLACAVVLTLHQAGVFSRLGDWWMRVVTGHFELAEPAPLPVWLHYGWHTLAAFVCAAVGAGLGNRLHAALYLAGVVFLSFTTSISLMWSGHGFEPFSGSLAAVLAGAGGIILGASIRGGKLHAFRGFFAGRLTEGKFADLIVNREPIRLSGTREVSTLTCRITNMADLVHRMEVADIEQLVSALEKEVAGFLMRQGAYLDACNSQGVTVQFGFPLRSADHAVAACRAALDLSDFTDALVAEAQKRWEQKPAIGIGVASGPVACGLIGHDSFQAYSVIGEPVDSSRRLSNLNAVYGSRILISSGTFQAAEEGIEVRPMEMVAAPGQTEPREMYELLAMKGCLTEEEQKSRDAFWEGVVALRKGDGKTAVAKLKSAERKGHEDRPLKYFLNRAESPSSHRSIVRKGES